ncbi:MAG: DUF4446 family protein [Parcubacteria group bacterium]|nr:DUF4446 family protein [Parcubacteria group bacterium]
MNQDIFLYILAVVALLLLGWVIRLEVRLSRLLSGKDGKSLEDSILFIKNGVEDLYVARKNSDMQYADLRGRLRRSIQRVETLRFNPFRGTGSGGNQSFVTALADEDGNGVIVSGIYARENVSVYAKSVKAFGSEFNLSDEEKEVLKKIKNEKY